MSYNSNHRDWQWPPSYDGYDPDKYPDPPFSSNEQSTQLPGSGATGLPPTSYAESPGGHGYFVNPAGQAIVLPSQGPSHQAQNQGPPHWHMFLGEMPVIGHYPQALGYYPTHGPYGSQLEYGDISSSLQGQPGGQVELESVSSSMSYTPLPYIPPAAQAQATFINPAGQATVLQSKRSDLVRSSQLTLHYLGNTRSSLNRSPPQFLQEMPFIGHWHYPQALSTLGDHPTHGHYRSQPEYEDRRSLLKGQLDGQVGLGTGSSSMSYTPPPYIPPALQAQATIPVADATPEPLVSKWRCAYRDCAESPARWQDQKRHLHTHLPKWICCVHPGCSWRGDRVDALAKHQRDVHPSSSQELANSEFMIYDPEPLVEGLLNGTISVEEAQSIANAMVKSRVDELGKSEIWGSLSGRRKKRKGRLR